jgi:hypothetical protein
LDIALGAASLFLAITGLITAIVTLRRVRVMSAELTEAEVDQVRIDTEKRKRGIRALNNKLMNLDSVFLGAKTSGDKDQDNRETSDRRDSSNRRDGDRRVAEGDTGKLNRRSGNDNRLKRDQRQQPRRAA